MQWNTQAGNITTNLNFNIDFTLLALSTTNVVTWDFHVNDSAKGRYDIILGRYLLTELVLNLKFFEHIIEAYDGPFNCSTTPMVDLVTYIFKDLNTGKLHLKNILPMITSKKYMNHSMYILLQNDYV